MWTFLALRPMSLFAITKAARTIEQC